MTVLPMSDRSSTGPTQAPAWIQVSGYAVMSGVSVQISGGGMLRLGGTTRDGRDITALLPRPLGAFMRRCFLCHRVISWTQAQDNRLGVSGACAGCIAQHLAECHRRHGRVPAPGEVYLGHCCHAIVPAAAVSPPDANGRRRWCCRTCRCEQVRQADHRRKARFRAGHLVAIRRPSR